MFAKHFHRMVKNFYYAIGGSPAPESRYYSPRREFRSSMSTAFA